MVLAEVNVTRKVNEVDFESWKFSTVGFHHGHYGIHKRSGALDLASQAVLDGVVRIAIGDVSLLGKAFAHDTHVQVVVVVLLMS